MRLRGLNHFAWITWRILFRARDVLTSARIYRTWGETNRKRNIAIADQLFALSQSPASCNYKLSPTNRAHGFVHRRRCRTAPGHSPRSLATIVFMISVVPP